MDFILAILMGIGLSASCGFRVFVPMLAISLGAKTGHITLASSFGWMGSDMAVVVFGLATVMEIAAYYLPWLDHLFDTIATPAAVVAGAVAAASAVSGQSDLMVWVIAAITGGSAAGAVQAFTVGSRLLSLTTTGGLGNPVVSTTETAAASVVSIMAVIMPILIVFFLIVMTWFILRWRRKRRQRKEAQTTQAD